tara:strand:- start:181 stop:798 length:618 start_codon:yes stop_codon:yes gene_type:complete
MFRDINIGKEFSNFLEKVENVCISDKQWEFPYKIVEDPIWETSATLLEMIRCRGIVHDGPPTAVLRDSALPETSREKYQLKHTRKLLRSKFPSSLDNPVIGYYPPGGFIGWHTNWAAPGWIILFNWSEEGKGYFKYYYDMKVVTLKDKPGWNARVGRFPIEYLRGEQKPENLLWHCAKTECRRFSFSYRFDDPIKWQEAVDCVGI